MAERRHSTKGSLDSHKQTLLSNEFAVSLHAVTKLSASGVCGTAGGNASATADNGCLSEHPAGGDTHQEGTLGAALRTRGAGVTAQGAGCTVG